MAKKGIRYAIFATRTETVGTGGAVTATYSNGKNVSPVVTFNGAINSSNVKDYGDDVVQDVDTSVNSGTLTVELNNDVDDIYTMLLGHSKDQTSSEVAFMETDIAPFIGVGAIGKSGNEWVGKWYPKVQFREPNDDNATKQETVTFGHITLEGEILMPEGEPWKIRKIFATLAEAKTWLNGKANIS